MFEVEAKLSVDVLEDYGIGIDMLAIFPNFSFSILHWSYQTKKVAACLQYQISFSSYYM